MVCKNGSSTGIAAGCQMWLKTGSQMRGEELSISLLRDLIRLMVLRWGKWHNITYMESTEEVTGYGDGGAPH